MAESSKHRFLNDTDQHGRYKKSASSVGSHVEAVICWRLDKTNKRTPHPKLQTTSRMEHLDDPPVSSKGPDLPAKELEMKQKIKKDLANDGILQNDFLVI